MAVKAAGGVSLHPESGNDTSKDQDWKIDGERWGSADNYVFWTTVLWLGPKIAVLAVPMLLTHLPPMLLARVYISTFPDRTHAIPRTLGFYCWFTSALILSLPAAVLILASLLLDYAAYYLFGGLFCTLSNRWGAAFVSMDKLSPYKDGPSVLLHLTDFFVCVCGQCARQNLGETHFRVCVMWLLIPWLKYYVNCNPLVYDLDHRLVQQISTTMEDCGAPDEVARTSRSIISQARQPAMTRTRLDSWNFIPHYPYPPPSRRWALGLQSGGGRYPGKFALIVHTTHANCTGSYDSTEQLVLSNSAEQPIYRVMLWYNNPYHFLTGWVEASISTGEPSQPSKRLGGEHPMWLVTTKAPQAAGRDSWTGSGMIDHFFDTWLPVFVWEVRLQSHLKKLKDVQPEIERHLQANSIANSRYQEVESRDGISAPKPLIGREKYHGQDTMSIYNMDRSLKRFGNRFTEVMMGRQALGRHSTDE